MYVWDCIGSEFCQSFPNDAMLLKDAEGAKAPMTHPSDFYCFKGLTTSCSSEIKTLYLLLSKSFNSKEPCARHYYFHTENLAVFLK